MEIPRHWRLKQQRYSLVGEICPHCDRPMFPPRDVCQSCGNEDALILEQPGRRPDGQSVLGTASRRRSLDQFYYKT